MTTIKKIFIYLSLFVLNPKLTLADGINNAFGDDSEVTKLAQTTGYNISVGANDIIGSIITTLLSLIGIFFLVLMVYGGFLWMSDRGNSDQVDKSKKLMTAAIIGLIIILGSYAISYFILNAISTETLQGSVS